MKHIALSFFFVVLMFNSYQSSATWYFDLEPDDELSEIIWKNKVCSRKNMVRGDYNLIIFGQRFILTSMLFTDEMQLLHAQSNDRYYTTNKGKVIISDEMQTFLVEYSLNENSDGLTGFSYRGDGSKVKLDCKFVKLHFE